MDDASEREGERVQVTTDRQKLDQHRLVKLLQQVFSGCRETSMRIMPRLARHGRVSSSKEADLDLENAHAPSRIDPGAQREHTHQ